MHDWIFVHNKEYNRSLNSKNKTPYAIFSKIIVWKNYFLFLETNSTETMFLTKKLVYKKQ